MKTFFGILVILGSLFSAFFTIDALSANAYPQQAASAALACVFVIVPYCLFRVSVDWGDNDSEKQNERIIAQLVKIKLVQEEAHKLSADKLLEERGKGYKDETKDQ